MTLQARANPQFIRASPTSLRARHISPDHKISSDFTRPAAGGTRPRPAAPFAVAFVPGRHRHTYINAGPATRITFTTASALGTRSRRGRHQATPFGLKYFFD